MDSMEREKEKMHRDEQRRQVAAAERDLRAGVRAVPFDLSRPVDDAAVRRVRGR